MIIVSNFNETTNLCLTAEDDEQIYFNALIRILFFFRKTSEDGQIRERSK